MEYVSMTNIISELNELIAAPISITVAWLEHYGILIVQQPHEASNYNYQRST